MNYLICALLTFLTCSAYGQVSSSDKQKIFKIVGDDFVEMTPKAVYPSQLSNPSISVDTSIFVLGDTTGIHVNNEYVLFRDSIQIRNENELLCIVKSSTTTVLEYQEFKDYVRDSIARVILAHQEYDPEAKRFIRWYGDNRTDKYSSLSDNDRIAVVEKNGLNWKTKFSYEDWDYVPQLTGLYVSKNERFRNQKVFDERKFIYQYKDKSTPVWNDYLVWSRNAVHDDDEFGVLSQIYPEISGESPVVGLLGTQAKAFCNWKQENIQKELNRAQLPYEVVVSLPEFQQLQGVGAPEGFHIESYDYTDQWKITKEEYLEFTEYVKDSILRTFLYLNLEIDELAEKLLQTESRYFDEGALEYVDYDPSDRAMNLELFPLDFKQKIRANHWVVKGALAKYNDQNPDLIYTYSTIRTRAKAQSPIMKFQKETRTFFSFDTWQTKNAYKDSILHRRIVFSYPDSQEEKNSSGVSLIWRPDKFIEEHSVNVNINEGALPTDQNSLIPDLTYEQALAFYNWKYPIDKFDSEEDNWQQFVYPSKEQFEKIQNGETIITDSRIVEYPTPLFRYVVHIYPK